MGYSTDLVFFCGFLLFISILIMYIINPAAALIIHFTGYIIYGVYEFSQLEEIDYKLIIGGILFLTLGHMIWYLILPFYLIHEYQKFKFRRKGVNYLIGYKGTNDGIDQIFDTIEDQDMLRTLALMAKDVSIRRKAIAKIEDQDILVNIMLNDDSYLVREYAARSYASKFDDDEPLKKLILKYPHNADNDIYLRLITDADVLESLVPYLHELRDDNRLDDEYIADMKTRISKLRKEGIR